MSCSFACLARCQGVQLKLSYADSTTIDDFRRGVREACCRQAEEDEGFIVVSYSRRVVGQSGSGHFSPLAAYDTQSDSVLILDTARFKYPPHWVKLELLWAAMLPVDPATSRSRGWAHLARPSGGPLSFSLLFAAAETMHAWKCRALLNEWAATNEPASVAHVADFISSLDGGLPMLLAPVATRCDGTTAADSDVVAALVAEIAALTFHDEARAVLGGMPPPDGPPERSAQCSGSACCTAAAGLLGSDLRIRTVSDTHVLTVLFLACLSPASLASALSRGRATASAQLRAEIQSVRCILEAAKLREPGRADASARPAP